MDSLFEVIAVHCFYGCPHVVRETSPRTASESMEKHYREEHPRGMEQLYAAMDGRPRTKGRKK